MNSLQKKILELKGFGQVKNPKIIFIGLEEHISLENNLKTKVDSMLKSRKFPPDGIIGRTMVWKYMARIILDYTKQATFKSFAKYYIEFKMFRDNNAYFINLFPLPKPSHKFWNWQYEAYFESQNDYEHKVIQYRFEFIRNLLRGNRNSWIICFGKNRWPYFEEMFNLRDGEMNEDFKVFPHLKVILTPFFNPQCLSYKKIRLLCNLIREERN